MHLLLMTVLVVLASGFTLYSRAEARRKATLPSEELSADDFEIID